MTLRRWAAVIRSNLGGERGRLGSSTTATWMTARLRLLLGVFDRMWHTGFQSPRGTHFQFQALSLALRGRPRRVRS